LAVVAPADADAAITSIKLITIRTNTNFRIRFLLSPS
jgi:hypothetical protein